MKKRVLVIIVIFAGFIKPIYTQNEPKQAINICAIAIPVMDMYVVNYEYLYHSRHGLAVRVEYAPRLKGANTNGVMWAGVLDYRWHLSPVMNGFFAEPYLRYRYSSGSGKTRLNNYKYNVSELNLGLNAGFRWISKLGINVVIAAGYGYSIIKENLTPSNSDIEFTFTKFKNDNVTNTSLFDAPFYGEVSIGYAF